MAYDKKTGTITTTSDDPKELERDIFRYFEDVSRQIAQDPNTPPAVAEEYRKQSEDLERANRAQDFASRLKTQAERARVLLKAQESRAKPALSDEHEQKGGGMKWIAIGLNVVLLLTVAYLFWDDGVPSGKDLFLAVIFIVAPLCSLYALTLGDVETWLGLYFKRKALEEKQRIKSLGG